MGILPCFSAIFTKGDNFYDNLFASMDDDIALKKKGSTCTLKEKNLLFHGQIPS